MTEGPFRTGQAKTIHSKETPCRFIIVLQSIQFNYKLAVTSPEAYMHGLFSRIHHLTTLA